MRRRGFSVVITRRSLFISLTLILLVLIVMVGPLAFDQLQRIMYGVKPGVTLDGYGVERLLEDELYDVIASLAEIHYIEAQNASWDWSTGAINEERIGQVVDIKATVDHLLNAQSHTDVSYVMVSIIPSITQGHFEPYYRGSDSEPVMSLMVNVDWGDEFILPMLEVFASFDVITTWFPTGRWAANNPDLANEISLAGHEIGNHGGWHGMPSQMNTSEVAQLIQEGEDIIVDVTGQKPQVFAPPAGDFNKETVAVAAELGYKTVLWTIDTVDWQRPAPTTIIDRVVERATNGGLVLMHPTQPTLEALPVIIDQLLRKGFRIVTVSELLND